MGTINSSMQAVQKAQIDLDEVDNLPPLGQDMVCVILNVPNIEKWSSSATAWADNGCRICICRHQRCGSRTRWTSPNTRFTPRLMPSQQEQLLWLTSRPVSDWADLHSHR